MTPAETFHTIEAVRAHRTREEKLALSTAWHTAALMRSKRMPSLKRFLTADQAQVVRGQEKAKMDAERRQMLNAVDLDKLNKVMKERHGS